MIVAPVKTEKQRNRVAHVLSGACYTYSTQSFVIEGKCATACQANRTIIIGKISCIMFLSPGQRIGEFLRNLAQSKIRLATRRTDRIAKSYFTTVALIGCIQSVSHLELPTSLTTFTYLPYL